jgi:hypothetical protein
MEQNSFDKTIESYVYKSPLVFLAVDNDNVILSKAAKYLPLSVGFEIECGHKQDVVINDDIRNEFLNIPYILHADVNGYEQRFRIPAGVEGLLCLYYITIKLKKYFELNLGSGIHYHIDLQNKNNFYAIINNINNFSWALGELDTWGYKGGYNSRKLSTVKGNWVSFRSQYNTAEIRIGEMTFDYELLIKRMIHGCQIIKRMGKQSQVTFEEPRLSQDYKINLELNLSFLKFKDNSLINKLASITENLNKLREKYYNLDDGALNQDQKQTFLRNRVLKI